MQRPIAALAVNAAPVRWLALALGLIPFCSSACGVDADAARDSDGMGDAGGDDGPTLTIPEAPAGPDCSARDCGSHGQCVVVGELARCRCDDGYAADEAELGPCESCPVESANSILRDLQPVSISGEITVDGTSLLGDTVNQGLIELVGERDGDRIPLGSVQSASYTAQVLPGVYAIDFAFGTEGNLIPRNQRVRVRGGVVIEGDRKLDVDVETATVAGVVTIAQRPVLDAPADYGLLFLVDRRTGGQVPLGPTFEGDFFVRVARGNYDLVYEWAASSEYAPVNSRAVLQKKIDIDADTELDVDIPAVTLDGEIRLTNLPEFPPDLVGAGDPNSMPSSAVLLRSVSDGGVVRLGSSEDGRYEVRLLPDTYEVLVEPFVPGPGAPLNPSGRLWSAGEFRIDSDQSFDIEIPTVRISGSVMVDGVRLYDARDYGDLFLRDVHENRLVALGPTFLGAYSVEVLPGRYEVIYAGRSSTGVAPLNPEAVVVDEFELVSDSVVDVDVASVRLQGALSVSAPNGAPANVALGTAALVDRKTGAEFPIGSFLDGQYDASVVPGHYDVIYSRGSSAIVHSRRLLIDDLEVEADTVQDIDLETLQRSFGFTLDGESPGPIAGANFYLRNDDDLSDARLNLSTTNDLLPGSYWLEYEGTGNSVVVENRRVRLECLTLAP